MWEMMLKWSKNSRHTLFTYNLLRFMSCFCNGPFYVSGKPFDFFTKLVAGCKVSVSIPPFV